MTRFGTRLNIARRVATCPVCGRRVGGLRATKRSAWVKACRRCHGWADHVAALFRALFQGPKEKA